MSWVEVVIALITAGLLKYLVDGIRWIAKRQGSRSPSAQQIAAITTVDQSLAVVARARDELAEDNARLRRYMVSERERYEADRIKWDERERQFRQEIDALENRIRALLSDLETFKVRHHLNATDN